MVWQHSNTPGHTYRAVGGVPGQPGAEHPRMECKQVITVTATIN